MRDYICVFIVCVLVGAAVGAHGQDGLADKPPMSIGAGLVDISTVTTKSDEEFKAEILRHTHRHTHVDFEGRITHLEESEKILVREILKLQSRVLSLEAKLKKQGG